MKSAPIFHLRLFGTPSLERSDGVPVSGRATQRHRLALLALLAIAPGQRLSRDKLIALLWPESDQDRGRNLLSVATYVLRSALGEEAMVTLGDDLRLSTEIVRADVWEFELACERDDHARAVDIYGGALLDGFFLSEAPEFEQWIERERNRFGSLYGSALEALADRAEAEGQRDKAVEWWKARAAHDPYDSRVALRLAQALSASGNPAGALRHVSMHERLLQSELGVAPSAELAAFAERLRDDTTHVEERPQVRQQESLRVEQVPDGAEAAGSPAPGLTTVASRALRSDRSRRARWVGSGAVAATILIVGAAWSAWPVKPDPEPSIAVLPFLDLSPTKTNDYFSDGLTEEIITRLSAIPDLKVISRTSAMHFKGSAQPIREIAKALDVAHILEGSVRQSNGRVRISAQLVDARSDEHLWAQNYEYELHDLFRVQEEIARQVVNALEVKLGDQVNRLLARQGTRDPEAYRLYRRGREAWRSRTREGHEQAIELFTQAIARDSTYADAYAGLSDAYQTAYHLNVSTASESEAYDRLRWAAERALSLDDESADAHTSYGVALWSQRDWPGAARELRRAIALNPGHATARSWYSLLLRGMGESDEALLQAERAHELDPFSVVVSYNHGWQCYMAHDYACAIEQHRSSLETGTVYPSAYRGLGLALALNGKPDEGVSAVREALQRGPGRPDFLADLAFVQALAGELDEARGNLGEAKKRPIEPFNIARAHVGLGEPDSAFAWLERSSWRWPHRAVLSDPALDPIRSDPRFAALVRRVEREMGLR